MAEYHVGCGNFGIYAGIVNKDGTEWKSKTECTKECLAASAQYLLEHQSYFGFKIGDKTYHLEVTEPRIAEDEE